MFWKLKPMQRALKFLLVLLPLLVFLLDLDLSLKKGLFILLLASSLWITNLIPLPATALLIPVLSVTLGVLKVKGALVSFSHPVIFLFLSGFVLAGLLSKYNIDLLIAKRLIALGRGNLYLSAFFVSLATSLLSMWISNTSTTALMLPIVLGLLKGKGQKLREYLLLLTAYSSSIGGMATLVGTPPNAIVGGILNLTFTDWLKYGIPAYLILFPLLFIILTLIFRPRGESLEEVKEEVKLEGKALLALALFLLVALLWVFSSKLGKYSDSLVGIFGVVLCTALGLMSWKEVQESVDWGTLILFGGGLTLSKVVKETHLAQFLSDQLLKLFGDSKALLIFFVIVFTVFLTELMSNTALTSLISPIFSQSYPSLLIPIALSASCAFMLPIATPPNAIVFGTGFVRRETMLKVGLILNVIFSLALTFFTLSL